VVIDYRSEGDLFGFLSLVSGDKSRANVVAVDDTIAYLFGKEDVLNLLDKNPSFTESGSSRSKKALSRPRQSKGSRR
jgi:CBS domain-containing protein